MIIDQNQNYTFVHSSFSVSGQLGQQEPEVVIETYFIRHVKKRRKFYWTPFLGPIIPVLILWGMQCF